MILVQFVSSFAWKELKRRGTRNECLGTNPSLQVSVMITLCTSSQLSSCWFPAVEPVGKGKIRFQ